MDFKEAVKDLAIAVIVGASSVMTTIYFTEDWEITAREKGWVSLPEWKNTATKSGWIKSEECPAFPISINMSSPGLNTTIPFEDSIHTGGGTRLETQFVVKTSRPVPKKGKIGIIFSPDSKKDLYVIFPYWNIKDNNKIFVRDSLSFPIKLNKSKTSGLYAFFTSNADYFGEVYANLDQIIKEDPEIVLTNNVKLILREKE